MQLEYFISKLEEIKPSEELLLKNGFPNVPNVIKNNYSLPKRNDLGGGVNQGSNSIERLVKNYETYFLRFNDYSFEREVKVIEKYHVFASSSYSFLAFKDPKGEILEIDKEELSELYYCAKDSDAFLEALLYVLEHSSLKLQGLIEDGDKSSDNEFIEKASLAAGGKKYSQFYKQII